MNPCRAGQHVHYLTSKLAFSLTSCISYVYVSIKTPQMFWRFGTQASQRIVDKWLTVLFARMQSESRNSLLEVIDSEFSNNRIEGRRLFAKGGGLFLLGNFLSVAITQCTFLSNAVDQFGGGVSASGVRSLNMTSVELTGNVAGLAGGGMFAEVMTGIMHARGELELPLFVAAVDKSWVVPAYL